MGMSEKICDRLKGAVAHALSKNQYGDVTDEKVDNIRDGILPLLMDLHKDNMLHDYALGVVGDRSENKVTIKLKVCLSPGSDVIDLGNELRVRNASGNEDNFDRAMKGI